MQPEFSFPNLEQLGKATEKELRDLGMGYRAGYITETVKILKEKGGQEFLLELRAKRDQGLEVREALTQLKGVGRKVADCIRLFSLDADEISPVDTHVFQLAQKMHIIKPQGSQKSLNYSMYLKITDAFE